MTKINFNRIEQNLYVHFIKFDGEQGNHIKELITKDLITKLYREIIVFSFNF